MNGVTCLRTRPNGTTRTTTTNGKRKGWGIAPHPFHEKGTTVGKYDRQNRYNAQNTKQIPLRLNRNTDADILAKLENVGNVRGYIKRLIREDIERNGL